MGEKQFIINKTTRNATNGRKDFALAMLLVYKNMQILQNTENGKRCTVFLCFELTMT